MLSIPTYKHSVTITVRWKQRMAQGAYKDRSESFTLSSGEVRTLLCYPGSNISKERILKECSEIYKDAEDLTFACFPVKIFVGDTCVDEFYTTAYQLRFRLFKHRYEFEAPDNLIKDLAYERITLKEFNRLKDSRCEVNIGRNLLQPMTGDHHRVLPKGVYLKHD